MNLFNDSIQKSVYEFKNKSKSRILTSWILHSLNSAYLVNFDWTFIKINFE